MIYYRVTPPRPRATGAVRRELQKTVDGYTFPLVELPDDGLGIGVSPGQRVTLRFAETDTQGDRGALSPAIEFLGGQLPLRPVPGSVNVELLPR
jgi:hypothetical protein